MNPLLRDSPESAELLFWAGKVCNKLDRNEKSITYFEKCLEIDKSHYGANLVLANYFVSLGKGETAARHFDTCIRLKPQQVSAHFGLAVAVANKEVAISHFKEILSRKPENWFALT